MSSLPKVAIVILNWNGQSYLEKFLPSVLATAYGNFEVIVSDNGSTDGSVSFLQNNFSQVKLICLDKNYGFAKGYNTTLEKVKADYYALINSDVEVEPGWLAPIVNLLEQDKMNAACQPKLLSYNNKRLFDYAGGAGGWLDRFGYPFAKGRIFDICEEDKGQYDATERVFLGYGCSHGNS